MDLDSADIQKLRENPALFVEKVIGVEGVYDYQQDVLCSNADRKAVVGGRQIGKTTMMAWLAIHEFTMYPNRNVLLVAPTERQALNFMRKLKKEISEWINNQDQYGLSYVSKSRMEGENGSWIQAVPALEETIRGLTVHSAFIDEAAFIDRHVLTSVISPMLATTNGQFFLTSTAWGKEGYFYERFDPDRDAWATFKIPSMRNPNIPERQITEWRKDMTETEFDREVLAQFSDKKDAYFKNKNIIACLKWAADIPEEQNVIYPDMETRNSFLGVDPASEGDDEAVFTSVDANGNVYDVEVVEKCEIPELEGEIRNLLHKNDRNYVEALIEENGIGEGPVAHLEEEFRQVKGFRSTLRSKESIYQETKKQLQSGNIKLPDREDLKKQMRRMEYEMTQRGNKKIHAPGEKKDDMVDSLVLSVAAMIDENYAERQEEAFVFGKTDVENIDERMQKHKSYTF